MAMPVGGVYCRSRPKDLLRCPRLLASPALQQQKASGQSTFWSWLVGIGSNDEVMRMVEQSVGCNLVKSLGISVIPVKWFQECLECCEVDYLLLGP